jgi:hypothetical protein
MAIVVEATTTSPFATGSTTFTQNKPTGTVNGDFLVAVVFTGNDNGTTELTVSGVPSGWTLIKNTLQTAGGSFNPVRVYTYYKIASSEGASWNWTLSTSGASFFYAGCIFRISGTNQVDASDDGTVSNDDTPTFTTGVSPTAVNGLLIMATVVTDAPTAGLTAGSYAITTSNPTWTELLDDNGGEGAGNSVHCSVAYAIRPESTPTGDWTLSLTGGSGVADSASQLISLPAVVSITTTIDAPGILTLSQGGSHDLILDNTFVLDTAGILTLNSGEVNIINQENTVWTEETKNSSTVWVEDNK